MKRRRLAAILILPAAILLWSCAGIDQRRLLAQDLRDAVAVAKPLLDEEAEAYVAAVESVLVALAENEQGFDYEAASQLIRTLEPVAREALIRHGRTPEEAAAILALIRIPLRRLVAAAAGPPPGE